MPDALTMIREACARFGWTMREMPAIPGEDGFVEVKAGLVVLRALIPREPILGYDPWDRLWQTCCAFTFVGE